MFCLTYHHHCRYTSYLVPVRDFGRPEDCVGAALLLCSNAGRYITGANLYVDGGRMLLILDPHSGKPVGRVSAGDATGVCFAQQQPRKPSHAIAQNAP